MLLLGQFLPVLPAIKDLEHYLKKVLHRVIHRLAFRNRLLNSAKVRSLCTQSYYPLVGLFGLY
jgi:hypothetical protein